LAKRFAQANSPALQRVVFANKYPIDHCSSVQSWEHGFPLIGLPVSCFIKDLPFSGLMPSSAPS
jgi:hypothetical protein